MRTSMVDERLTNEMLVTGLWASDTFVDFDRSLNAAIKRLRDALGDSAENPTFVETVARRGYRFLAPVTVNGSKPAEAAPPAGVSAAALHRRPLFWIVAAALAVTFLLIGTKIGVVIGQRRIGELKLTRLTATPADDRVRASMISRDGKYLAYSDATGFYVQLIDTGETHPVSLPDGFLVESGNWLPDNVHLVVSMRRLGVEIGIWEVSVLGGSPRQISDFGSRPAPSPDGKRFCFVRNTGKSQELWVMMADGSAARKLDGVAGDWFGRIAWSPDGGVFAYTKAREAMGGWGTKATLALGYPDSQRSETLINSPALSAPLVWATHNRLIYAQAEAPPQVGDSNLWYVDLDRENRISGEPHRITRDAGLIDELGVSGDGKRLAVLREFNQPEIYLSQIESGNRIGTPRRLTLDERGALPFAWTPDSKQVLLVSNRTGTFSIFKQKIDDTTPEMVVKGSPAAGLPRLSPDGKQIIYIVYPSVNETLGNVKLMRVPLLGGSSQEILESSSLGNHQCALLPSTTCLYSDVNNEGMTFWYFDPMKGKGTQLLHIPRESPYYNWSLAADGSTLAISEKLESRQVADVRFITLASGDTKSFDIKECSLPPSLDWAADSRSLWAACSRPQDDGGILLNIDVNGNARPVWKAKAQEVEWAIPSPDGRYLALAQSGGTSNVWMIEHF